MTDTRTMTLVEFLTARLDEDEAPILRAQARDRAYSPGRALREVEAKRGIIAEGAPEYLLVWLASVYSDHPDYDPVWT